MAHWLHGKTYTAGQWKDLRRPNKHRFQWLYDDGGREAAGRRGRVGDCVCRAIAIATEQPYEQIYKTLNELCKPFRETPRSRTPSCQFGMPGKVYQPFLEGQGWCFHKLPDYAQFNASNVPQEGVSIISLYGHIATVKHGVIRDTFDCSYKGIARIYGFYRRA